MHDAPPVRGRKRFSDLGRRAQQRFSGQRPALQAPGKRLPLEQLHDEKVV